MTTTHDAAVTSTGLLPAPLLDKIAYTADNDQISEIAIEWLQRFRYVIHQTTKPIVVVGCKVNDIDPARTSRFFKSARAWLKRIVIFDNDKELTRQLPEDAGILVFMKWVSHAQFTPLKTQALRTRYRSGEPRAPTPILFDANLRDLKQLIAYSFLSPEQFIERVRPKFPHEFATLDSTARALLRLQADQTIRRMALAGEASKTADRFPEIGAMATETTTEDGGKQKTKRGAVKAFMARHPTPEEMATPEWKAAKTDDAKGEFLLPIAHAEGVMTTHGTLTNYVRELRRASEAAIDAERKARADALTSVGTSGPHGLPFDPARAVDLAKQTLAEPAPPPPSALVPTSEAPAHPALASAHTAIQQGFDAIRQARQMWTVIGEQLDLAEMAFQDAQRYAGTDLIVDMQQGIEHALKEAMAMKFGQFLPVRKP